ncbi:hypothetical protein ACP70R_034195 [Stipagrostis hirtigluma subsp. patula]
MAVPRIFVAASVIVVVAVVAVVRSRGTGGGVGCFGPLVDCAATPPEASASGGLNGTAFRASLSPLLAALPSAAAATGFASLRGAPAAGRDSAHAHALGLCFGGGAGPAPSGSACLACLSAAVAAVRQTCANDTRRAGVWGDGCLLAYDDANASSASEDGGSRLEFHAGDTRAYSDRLDQTLADLAKALAAEPRGQTIWKTVQSVVLFFLAGVGSVAVVLLMCALVAAWLLVDTLSRSAPPGQQHGNGAAGLGEGVAVYVAATYGGAPVCSVAAQVRIY